MKKTESLRTEPMIQYCLFAVLVVMTPFMVVTRFLQGAVYEFSHLKLPLLGFELPIVATVAAFALIAFVVYVRREITFRKVKAAGVILGMILLSYWVQDLYGGMAIYDLQKNWHYVAYGAYPFFFFRAFSVRGMQVSRMILFAYLTAIGLSTFDEAFQFKMSNRIFDVSDIAKDSWGAIIGLILVLFVAETYGRVELDWKNVWRKRIRDYFDDPLGTLLLVGILSTTAILVSPLLTESSLIGYFLLAVASLSVIIVLTLHNLQRKTFRLVAGAIIGLAITGLGASTALSAGDHIVKSNYGLTIFRGVPVPFFDLLIYPNGLPRLVDKKHFFNNQDKQFLFQQRPDILIIGGGHNGKGGKGFAVPEGTYFAFNRYIARGTQVIVLSSSDACREYNRLKAEGKRVLLVIHSTC